MAALMAGVVVRVDSVLELGFLSQPEPITPLPLAVVVRLVLEQLQVPRVVVAAILYLVPLRPQVAAVVVEHLQTELH